MVLKLKSPIVWYFYEISTLKNNISHSKSKVKTYEFLACMRPVKLLGCDSMGTFSWSETAHEQLCMHKDFYHGNSLGIK